MEVGRYAYSNREQGARLDRSYGGGKWRCVRHSEHVLSPSNLTREVTITAGPSAGVTGLFWHGHPMGLVSGFAYGPGWKAFAGDFPEGTRIVVRVEAVLPKADA